MIQRPREIPQVLARLREFPVMAIRVGDSLAENKGGAGGTWNQPLDEVGAHYARARRMQLDALARFPGHVGLRDDLCWSFLRMLAYEGNEGRERRIEECIRVAEELLADTPDRDLSKYALCSAHRHGAIHLLTPPALPQSAAIAAHRHLTEALRLSRELVRSQPRRGAFVMEHLSILMTLMSLSRAEPHHDHDGHELPARTEELERFLRGLDSEQLSRVDINGVVSHALGLLAATHAHLGREEQARETARWLEAVAADPTISWTPRGRASLDHSLERLREMGLTRDAEPASSTGSE